MTSNDGRAGRNPKRRPPTLDRAPAAAPAVRVWDPGVRLFHWLLVAAVAVAAFTGFVSGAPALEVHIVAGTAIAGLVFARVVWGRFGATHARFADFAYGPRAVLAHLRDLVAGAGHRHLGHNPLGAMMVFALLLVLAAIVVTGTVTLGGAFKQGPLGAFVGFAAGWQVRGIHKLFSVLLLVMIAAHLLGVAFESRRGRENLVRAMVTGRKAANPGGGEAPAVAARPWPALAILIVGGGGAAAAIAALAALPAPGLPPARLDPAYVEECGSCHFAFPPSLAPAATWTAVMDGLAHHFGENAGLDPDVAARLRAYLLANSAEHADTLAANRLRVVDPAEPLRITATPFWRRVHGDIPDGVFADRRVGGRVSCAACHDDAATGRFAPQSIEIPEALQ